MEPSINDSNSSSASEMTSKFDVEAHFPEIDRWATFFDNDIV
jgi:hypothetical protein